MSPLQLMLKTTVDNNHRRVVHCVEQQWPELRPAVVFSAASPGCLKAHGGSMTIAQIDRGVVPVGPTRSVRKTGRSRVIWRGRAVALLRDLLVVVVVAMAILLLLPAALAAQAAVAV
jgi:hypothetical protein